MPLTRFDQRFRDGPLTRILDDRGVECTYTPSGAAALSIQVEVIPEELQLQRVGPEGVARYEYAREIRVSQADVATVTVGADTVAIPKFPNDVGTTNYKVATKIGEAGGSWRLGLKGA